MTDEQTRWKITAQKWLSAHDLAEMVVDCAFKQALMLFVLSRTTSEVRLNDLIDEAKEKATPKFEKTIDQVLDLLYKNGVDLNGD